MKILYLGKKKGTSIQRAKALLRLGHEVLHVDPDSFVPQQKWLAKFHWETGGIFCQNQVTSGVLRAVAGQKFDVVWVDSGRYVSSRLVRQLRQKSKAVLNYNQDNPYGKRDRFSWTLFRRAVSAYDLIVAPREANIPQATQMGARNVIRVFLAADEVAHAPRTLTPQDFEQWGSDVAFIGTWFPERGPFLAELVAQDVPLSIFGSDWHKAPEWPALKPFWKGPDTHDADDYAKKIQCSKICLGLLSKGNHDLHTTRSAEIPYLGGLLCGERTSDHQKLYVDGEEAVFWSDAAECARVCFDLLSDEPKRQRIARQGHTRILKNGNLNEQMMTGILEHLASLSPL